MRSSSPEGAAALERAAAPENAAVPEDAAAPEGAIAPDVTATRRVAVVGMSVGVPCGMHAHAGLLAGALEGHGVACTEHWLQREVGSLRRGRAEVHSWTGLLRDELRDSAPDVVLLHYSVFAYSHRGFPLFVPATVSALRRSQVPLVGFMHELAFPWKLGGVRGATWALTHRAALVSLLRMCQGVVVTTDFRAQWLSEQGWLAKRPLALAPVFSNLPAPSPDAKPHTERTVIGMFGYSYDTAAITLVLDAIRELRAGGQPLELALLGAPGRRSSLADTWVRAATARGLETTLRFAGPLPAQELSDALASCDVLLFADGAGPSSRKGTLAGSLASGRPLVAADGPRTWSELIRSRAAWVVEPDPSALSLALGGLLADPQRRESLGERGRAFADDQMGLDHSAVVVSEMIRDVLRRQG